MENSISTDNKNKTELLIEKHLHYLVTLDQTKDKDAIGYYTNEHLKMAALYWGITALNVINGLDSHNVDETIQFIQKCQALDGGYGGSVGHDSQITSTHYALLILSQFNKIDIVDKAKIGEYVKNLQVEDGSFKSDDFGEIDTRFSYSALSILKGLNLPFTDYINLPKATEYVLSCQNFDGGFGGIPGAESHAAYTFCCVGFLSVTDQVKLINIEHTGQWLGARQTHMGGFNGRPEKLPDVCYSWWVLSSMYMIGTSDYFDHELLIKFILECQDEECGGISDRQGNMQDVFHTFFGLAGLSLLGFGKLKLINPTFAIPQECVDQLFTSSNLI